MCAQCDDPSHALHPHSSTFHLHTRPAVMCAMATFIDNASPTHLTPTQLTFRHIVVFHPISPSPGENAHRVERHNECRHFSHPSPRKTSHVKTPTRWLPKCRILLFSLSPNQGFGRSVVLHIVCTQSVYSSKATPLYVVLK